MSALPESGASDGDPHDAAAAAAPPVRRVLVFGIVALALMMMSVDSTIVATALHALQHGLGTSINWAGWTITAYLFGFVVMLPLSGKLAERYGRRRVFVGSVLTFTLASLACGLADDIRVLIVLRALQAAGGAGFTPSATGIVVDHFGAARDRAVSLFGSIFPVGAMIGPIFGGLFVTYWDWRGVFFVNVPIGALIVVLALRHIPADPPRVPERHPSMDARGMLLLAAGVLAGMLAASMLGSHGQHPWWPAFVPAAAAAPVAFGLFLRHIERTPQPFIAPRLVRGRDFGPVNLFNAWYGGTTFGIVTLIPLYAANRYGMDALSSGTLLVAQGAATITMTILAALALRRTGHRRPLYAGAATIIVGTLLLALPPPAGITPYAWLAGAALVVGAGAGTINPASRNAGLQLAPESSSTLAALRTMSLQLGSIVTVSAGTAVIAGFADPGRTQAWFYVAIALLLVAALPLIARVPEHHGAW
ncbi:MAG TPA: MFS transporter [Rubrivivax sp.]|nr:MFS transporter [Pseudomonadota bacterium]HOM13827.1 MFS transporter [Rubrivivax sp.]